MGRVVASVVLVCVLFSVCNAVSNLLEQQRKFANEVQKGPFLRPLGAALKEKRALEDISYNLPYSSFTELTSTIISGSLTGFPNSTASFVVYIDVGQIGEVVVTSQEGDISSNFRTLFSQVGGGTQSSLSASYFQANDTTTYTLGDHCPRNPATYYFALAADYPVTYQISVNKVATPVLSKGVNTPTFRAPMFSRFLIEPLPNCSDLVVTINSNSFATLAFECDNQPDYAYCPMAGISAVKQTNDMISRQQLYVQCTNVGNYYLTLPAFNTLVNATVTIETSYSCPSYCVGQGVCNVSTGECACGFNPFPAPGQQPCPQKQRSLEREVRDLSTIVDIPVNGTAFNYSNPVAVPDYMSMVNVRLVVPAVNPSASIRLVATVRKRDDSDYQSQLNFYFNPESPASFTQYTSQDSAYNSGYEFAEDPSIEVFLCAGVTNWYVGITSSYYPNMPIPNITFTASVVNNIVVAPGMFWGAVSNFPAYGNRNSGVVQFTATYDGYAFVDVNDDASYGYLYGIASVQSCGSFGPTSTSLYNDTTNYGYNVHYQAVVPITTGSTYYVVIIGSMGAKYTGELSFVSSKVPCSACISPNGFCNAGGSCVCRYGWKGYDCGQLDTGNFPLSLTNGVAASFAVTGQPYYTGSTQTVTLPVITPGNNLLVTVSPNQRLYVYGPSTSIPNYYASYARYYYEGGYTGTFNAYTGCVLTSPIQYYIILATNNVAGSSGQITAKLQNVLLVADGMPHTFDNLAYGTGSFRASLPADTCTTSYEVTITPSNSTQLAYSTQAGSDRWYNCEMQVNMPYNATANHYYAVVPVYNCSKGIDIQLNVYTESLDNSVTITVAPVNGCPNNCTGTNGVCYPGKICKCNYPYVGLDCASYDAPVNTIMSRLTTCKANYSIAYGGIIYANVENFYCDIIYDDTRNIPAQIKEVEYYLNSDSCRQELKQIMCDMKFLKLQSQDGGGVKAMYPCNCLTFRERCAPNQNYIGYYEQVCKQFNESLVAGTAQYICNPNPGPLGKADPYPVSTTYWTNTGPYGPTGSTPGNNGSDASGLVVSVVLVVVCALLSAML